MATEKRLIDANRFLRVTRFQEGVYPHKILKTEIEEQPTVDAVEVVRGWWIELPSMEPDYKCSECGRTYAWWEPSEAHYCPNCGANMDGDSV